MKYADWIMHVADECEKAGISYEEVNVEFWRAQYQGGLSPSDAVDEVKRLNAEEAYGETAEGFNFDKFMDSTVMKETRQATHDVKEVSPQRRLARGYQEHPLGKIRYGVRRG